MSEPFGEPDAADVISSGREDSGTSQWPRLRRRRSAWVTAGVLGLAGVVAAAVLVRPPPAAEPSLAPHGPPLPVTVPVSGVAGADGVFARGAADGYTWQLAVQDIADPGRRCIPAVTINGNDADPVYPAPGNGADVTLGPAAPGIGFAFVQVPDGIAGLAADGHSLPAITATACGLHYRLTGFAYRLTSPPQITAVSGHPGWPKRRPATSSAVPGSTVPIATIPGWPDGLELPLISEPSPSVPQPDGMWNNVGPTSADNATGVIATGKGWLVTLMFSVTGDCYTFSSADAAGIPQVSVCGPVSMPDGPETILALPLSLSFPPAGRPVPTGYAVRVSPATAHLRASLSDGSTQLVTPRVVDGRRYAAFSVGSALRLKRLTWLDATGQAFASTTALPRYGYTQFQP
jgi:hypothetical protein